MSCDRKPRSRGDIFVYQGDTEPIEFEILDCETELPSDKLVSAASVAIAIKQDINDAVPLFVQNIIDGTNGNDWANGIVRVLLDPANTALLRSDGRYDLEATYSSGAKTTLGWGVVRLNRQVNP